MLLHDLDEIVLLFLCKLNHDQLFQEESPAPYDLVVDKSVDSSSVVNWDTVIYTITYGYHDGSWTKNDIYLEEIFPSSNFEYLSMISSSPSVSETPSCKYCR